MLVGADWGSVDNIYRYTLWRLWEADRAFVQFIGLNPSTADEGKNDPTLRRCIQFARDWGYGGMCMTNLFAYRATKPKDMKSFPEPIGPDNDKWLTRVAASAGLTVAAWGTLGGYLGRDAAVRALIVDMQCLGYSKDGHPFHPLMLPKNAVLEPLRSH